MAAFAETVKKKQTQREVRSNRHNKNEQEALEDQFTSKNSMLLGSALKIICY